MILDQFQKAGRDLFTRGLVPCHSGNISIRVGDNLIITRRGSNLGNLEEQDLIETGISKNDRNTPLASSELPLHRAIYQYTSARAIVHAHPPHAVALSLVQREIIPSDLDGRMIFERVAVIGEPGALRPGGLSEISQDLLDELKKTRIVIACGHGTVAIGQLIDEGLKYTTSLEDSCQVICLLKSLNVDSTAADLKKGESSAHGDKASGCYSPQ